MFKSTLSKIWVPWASSDARPVAEGYMGLVPETGQLLSRLPPHLATDLFASAKPVKLAADQVLFLAGDPGDCCYRVEDGLLKVTMASRSGTERILSFISRGGIVGELAILDGPISHICWILAHTERAPRRKRLPAFDRCPSAGGQDLQVSPASRRNSVLFSKRSTRLVAGALMKAKCFLLMTTLLISGCTQVND
jgi:hypothetical protein